MVSICKIFTEYNQTIIFIIAYNVTIKYLLLYPNDNLFLSLKLVGKYTRELNSAEKSRLKLKNNKDWSQETFTGQVRTWEVSKRDFFSLFLVFP